MKLLTLVVLFGVVLVQTACGATYDEVRAGPVPGTVLLERNVSGETHTMVCKIQPDGMVRECRKLVYPND